MNHKLLLSAALLSVFGCQQPEPPARPEVVAPAASKPPEAPLVVSMEEECAEVRQAYKKFFSEPGHPCTSDAECILHIPATECCGGYGIHVADQAEILRIDTWYLSLDCEPFLRDMCEIMCCITPLPALCDKISGQCKHQNLR